MGGKNNNYFVNYCLLRRSGSLGVISSSGRTARIQLIFATHADDGMFRTLMCIYCNVHEIATNIQQWQNMLCLLKSSYSLLVYSSQI